MSQASSDAIPNKLALLSVFELGGRLALLAGALLYGLGFVVENIHLARYGYFSLTLFERRYAMAGFWALCPVLLFFLFDSLVEYATRLRKDPSAYKIPKWARSMLSMVILLGLIYAVENAFAQILGVRVEWLWWFGFIYGAALLYVLMARKAVARWRELNKSTALSLSQTSASPANSWSLARSVISEVEWNWTPLAVTYLVLFTYNLFPRIPASWGGGGAETVQLVLSANEASGLVPTADHSQVSSPLTLLATTTDDYVILLDSSRIAYIRRDLVRAVTLSGHFTVPQPIRRSYAPASDSSLTHTSDSATRRVDSEAAGRRP